MEKNVSFWNIAYLILPPCNANNIKCFFFLNILHIVYSQLLRLIEGRGSIIIIIIIIDDGWLEMCF